MIRRFVSSLAKDRRGTAGIEYALAAPALMLLVLGATDVGRLAWTQATLDFAASSAARCAAFDDACATDSQVKTFAATQTYGMTVPSSAFAVSLQTCGRQVSVARAFRFVTPMARTVTLQASACYPLQP